MKSTHPCHLLPDFDDPEIESIWIKVRPHRLPRGTSALLIGTVYHPPSSSAEQNPLLTHQQEPPRPISEFSVIKKLSALNTNKASGLDGIPSWVLKESARYQDIPVFARTDVLPTAVEYVST